MLSSWLICFTNLQQFPCVILKSRTFYNAWAIKKLTFIEMKWDKEEDLAINQSFFLHFIIVLTQILFFIHCRVELFDLFWLLFYKNRLFFLNFFLFTCYLLLEHLSLWFIQIWNWIPNTIGLLKVGFFFNIFLFQCLNSSSILNWIKNIQKYIQSISF